MEWWTFRRELKTLLRKQDESREAIIEIGQELKQEIMRLGQELISKQEEKRQEEARHHEEIMNMLREIIKPFELTKENPEIKKEDQGIQVGNREEERRDQEQQLSGARDCSDIYKAGKNNSGVYRIKADGLEGHFHVYCEMEKEGGGWTVLQRRGNFGTPVDYFNKSWAEFKSGFGKLDQEFWLGNDRISALSSQDPYELRIDMWDYDNSHYHANYKTFRVRDEAKLYKLYIGDFSGNTGDHMFVYNGMRFSTYDCDNDLDVTRNCAASSCGSWWYRECYIPGTLNGKRDPNSDSLAWFHSPALALRLSSVVMMIRPNHFLHELEFKNWV